MRILIAEDERILADSIADALRTEAFAVDVAYDGDGALERLGCNRYDVLVLDRDLPVVHGDDVCRRVVWSAAPVRVLMLTAAGTVPDRVAGLSMGADDYLTKPFAFEELPARKEFGLLAELMRADGRVLSGTVLSNLLLFGAAGVAVVSVAAGRARLAARGVGAASAPPGDRIRAAGRAEPRSPSTRRWSTRRSGTRPPPRTCAASASRSWSSTPATNG